MAFGEGEKRMAAGAAAALLALYIFMARDPLVTEHVNACLSAPNAPAAEGFLSVVGSSVIKTLMWERAQRIDRMSLGPHGGTSPAKYPVGTTPAADAPFDAAARKDASGGSSFTSLTDSLPFVNKADPAAAAAGEADAAADSGALSFAKYSAIPLILAGTYLFGIFLVVAYLKTVFGGDKKPGGDKKEEKRDGETTPASTRRALSETPSKSERFTPTQPTEEMSPSMSARGKRRSSIQVDTPLRSPTPPHAKSPTTMGPRTPSQSKQLRPPTPERRGSTGGLGGRHLSAHGAAALKDKEEKEKKERKEKEEKRDEPDVLPDLKLRSSGAVSPQLPKEGSEEPLPASRQASSERQLLTTGSRDRPRGRSNTRRPSVDALLPCLAGLGADQSPSPRRSSGDSGDKLAVKDTPKAKDDEPVKKIERIPSSQRPPTPPAKLLQPAAENPTPPPRNTPSVPPSDGTGARRPTPPMSPVEPGTLKNLVDQLETLLARNAKLGEEQEDYEAVLRELKGQVRQAEEDMEENNKLVNQMDKEYMELEEAGKQKDVRHEMEVSKLNDTIAALKKEHEARVAELQGQMDELQASEEATAAALSVVEGVLARSSPRASEERGVRRGSAVRIESIHASFEQMRKENQDLHAEVEAIAMRLAERDAELKAAADRHTAAAGEAATLTAQVAVLEQAAREHDTEVQVLMQKLSDAETEAQKAEAVRSPGIAATTPPTPPQPSVRRSGSSGSVRRTPSGSRTATPPKADLSAVKAKVDTGRRAGSEAREQVAGLEQQVEALRKENDALTTQVAKREAEADELRQHLDNMHEDKEELERTIESGVAIASVQKSENEALHSQEAALRKSLQEVTAERDELAQLSHTQRDSAWTEVSSMTFAANAGGASRVQTADFREMMAGEAAEVATLQEKVRVLEAKLAQRRGSSSPLLDVRAGTPTSTQDEGGSFKLTSLVMELHTDRATSPPPGERVSPELDAEELEALRATEERLTTELKEKVDALEAQARELEARNAAVAEQKAALAELAASSETTIGRLEDELSAQREKAEAAERKLEAQQGELDTATQAAVDAQTEISAGGQRSDALSEEIARLKDEVTRLTNELRIAEEKNTDLEGKVKDVRAELDAAKADCLSRDDELLRVLESVKLLEKVLEEKSSMLEAAEEREAVLERDAAKAEDATRELQRLKNHLDDHAQRYQQLEEQLRAEIHGLQREVETQHEENMKLQGRLDAQAREHKKLTEATAGVHKHELERALKVTAQQLENEKRRSSGVNLELKKLTQRLNVLQQSSPARRKSESPPRTGSARRSHRLIHGSYMDSPVDSAVQRSLEMDETPTRRNGRSASGY